MKLNLQTYQAIKIMAEVHKDHLRKDGIPYITHSIAVMLQMETEEEKQVAAMHDVFEMSNKYKFADLAMLGFSYDVIEALILITRDKKDTYKEYIEILAQSKLAIKVKLADLEHNLFSLTAEMDPTGSMIRKYLKARQYLQEKEKSV